MRFWLQWLGLSLGLPPALLLLTSEPRKESVGVCGCVCGRGFSFRAHDIGVKVYCCKGLLTVAIGRPKFSVSKRVEHAGTLECLITRQHTARNYHQVTSRSFLAARIQHLTLVFRLRRPQRQLPDKVAMD
jgi:hypothetical protein